MNIMAGTLANRTARLALAAAGFVASGAGFAGTITGGVAFPGDSIPALTVVAVEQSTGRQYTVATRAGQRSYRLDVPAGTYIVFAVPHGPGVEDEAGEPPLRGAYSAFSQCVLNSPEKAAEGGCQDHRLLTVDVGGKDTRKRIDLYDWYLPDEEKARILSIKVAR
jgi:hypothetical protein